MQKKKKKSKQIILVMLSLKNFGWVIRNWNSMNFWQATFCHLDFSPGDSILSLLLLFLVCMRLRGHSWKSSVVGNASGDKCFIWSEVYNQLFLSVEWRKETGKKKHRIFADLIVYSYSVEFSTAHLYWHQRRDQMQRKASGRAHVGLFLYQVLMALELTLTVWPKVCVGLRRNPGAAVVFSINQGLSIPKDAFWAVDHPGVPSSATSVVSNCSSHAKQTERLKHLKQRPTWKLCHFSIICCFG